MAILSRIRVRIPFFDSSSALYPVCTEYYVRKYILQDSRESCSGCGCETFRQSAAALSAQPLEAQWKSRAVSADSGAPYINRTPRECSVRSTDSMVRSRLHRSGVFISDAP